MRKMLPFLCALFSVTVYGQSAGDSINVKKDSTPWALYHTLEARLDNVMDTDQASRSWIETIQKKYGMESRQMDSLYKVMRRTDSANLVEVKRVLGKYGWLGIAEIGEKANMALFMVIQHSDSLTQVTYLPMMRQAVKDGKAKPADLALLEDRVLCGQGKKQLYGSQVRVLKNGKYALYPIEDEANVNKRRDAAGLEPLESYAHYFGIDYHLPK